MHLTVASPTTTEHPPDRRCHHKDTAKARSQCGACAPSVEVDTAELLAVTRLADAQQALVQAMLAEAICISCKESWGKPHGPDCEFETFGGAA